MLLRECSRFVWHDKEFLVFIALTFSVYIILCVHWPVQPKRREWESGDGENDNNTKRGKKNGTGFYNLICGGHGLRLLIHTVRTSMQYTLHSGFVIGCRSRIVVIIDGMLLELSSFFFRNGFEFSEEFFNVWDANGLIFSLLHITLNLLIFFVVCSTALKMSHMVIVKQIRINDAKIVTHATWPRPNIRATLFPSQKKKKKNAVAWPEKAFKIEWRFESNSWFSA